MVGPKPILGCRTWLRSVRLIHLLVSLDHQDETGAKQREDEKNREQANEKENEKGKGKGKGNDKKKPV